MLAQTEAASRFAAASQSHAAKWAVLALDRKLGGARTNLVSIFGAARQGKSFLMNCLMGRQDTFRISNARDPCTEGIDLSRSTMPLRDFSTVGGGMPQDPVTGVSSMRIGFVDAEGQGDRDVNYDARLASPVLLTSRCVIVFMYPLLSL